MRYHGRQRYSEQQRMMHLGVLLVNQISQLERKPPITLAVMAVQVLLYFNDSLRLLDPLLEALGLRGVPRTGAACLQPRAILQRREWGRLVWAPLLHADDMHLFYNMSSLVWKGAQLEPSLGPLPFALLLLELLATTSAVYLAIAAAAAAAAPALAAGPLGALAPGLAGLYHGTCAVGFSGVLFGLKVVLNWDADGWSRVAGVSLPTKYLAWGELFYIQLITPRASFVGHLAGILAGMLHMLLLRHWLQPLGSRAGGHSPGHGGRNGYHYQYPGQQAGARWWRPRGDGGQRRWGQ